MSENLEIPAPDASGNSGEQTTAVEGELIPAKWPGTSPVTDAVDGIIANNARAFGNPAAQTLLAANLKQTQMIAGIWETRCDKLETKVDSQRDELEQSRLANAGLQARIDTGSSLQRLRRICGLLTGVLITAGIALIFEEKTGLGLGAIALSIPFLVGSMILEDKRAGK